MSTQLRLLTKPGTEAASTGPLRGRASAPRRPSTRRAVHWQGQWRLDTHTREVGKAGVASARAALARAQADEREDLRAAS